MQEMAFIGFKFQNFSAEQFVADLKNIPWNTLDMHAHRYQ
jgi:hypothetical protein